MNRYGIIYRTMGWAGHLVLAATLALSLSPVNAQPKPDIAKTPEAATKPVSVPDLKNAARNLVDKGKYSEAMAVIEQVLKIDPTDEYAIGVMPLLADKVEFEEQKKAQQARKIVEIKPAIAPRDQLELLLPETNFEGVALGDVMEFLRDLGGESITADWNSLEKAGIDRTLPITHKFRNVRLWKVVDVILAEATLAAKETYKLEYSVDADRINFFAYDRTTQKLSKTTVEPNGVKTPTTRPSSIPGGIQ